MHATIQVKDGKETAYSMDPQATGSELLQMWQSNFLRHLNGNRAPFGVYIHAAWVIQDNTRAETLKTFIRWVATQPGVVFATPSQVVAWMKSPVRLSQVQTFRGSVFPLFHSLTWYFIPPCM